MRNYRNSLNHYNKQLESKNILPITQQTKSNLQKILKNNSQDRLEKLIQDDLNNTSELISNLYALEML
jgi:hypothetical protein